ncbi:mitochondrial outer membrane protein SLC25A46 isoform X2 [Dendroctonus ponderosae]|uniref:Solute carrier family 25 member 46 n=1 Tax=Dendroctonus ponderosae TaxID=77166 RepID=A0AAR5NXB2_DENPD|nr:mitochondrial outer membrane protein SLC25A46 isoform X2 [Dendroctonus ponderosae]XP_048517623.1 mitochondrial outer membrane protein SLC25A46 isoform X2 [Dendroctonus ponderosae]
MDSGDWSHRYGDYNGRENYLDAPDLTRRLPVHDEYYLNREHLPQYTSPKPYQSPEVSVKRYIGSGVAFASLITENLLSHPFLVLRRQCQVNHSSRIYHLLPFTLLPPVCHLQQHQGLTTLWKGLGSVLLVRGMSLGVEDLLSKLTPWPKEISPHSSLKQFFQHTMLKCVSLAVVTPFYSASFVETVQSEIASERPGTLDVFREGFIRLLTWGAPAKGRMLPIWALILPTITLGLAKYLFSMMVKGVATWVLNIRQNNKWQKTGTIPKDSNPAMEDINLSASLIATISSDIVFYPCETIVHRLHLQGTRTIVDNLGDGRSVLPILTNYSGALDCYSKCILTEGTTGLYKGFGALILQYVAHIALIKISRFVLTEVGALLKKPEPKLPNPVDDSPPAISNVTNPPKSYLLP